MCAALAAQLRTAFERELRTAFEREAVFSCVHLTANPETVPTVGEGLLRSNRVYTFRGHLIQSP